MHPSRGGPAADVLARVVVIASRLLGSANPAPTHMLRTRFVSALVAASLVVSTRANAQSVPTPQSQLGFAVGADRSLADWTQITGYFSKLAQSSPAVKIDTLGPTTEGRPFVMATISTPANIRRLDAIRAAQARLADPRTLSETDARALIAAQPSVVVVSCNIHSTEIGSAQMAMEFAYRLATVDTLQRQLEHTVVLLIPSMNPDGEQMVVDWYRKGLGTQWEGGPMPWMYHKYVGHDDNRDWYMITQQETKLVTDMLYRRWYPEIFYDVHQQGNEGMRITVPPHVDPIDPNVDPLIVRGINLIGMQMSWALESRGKSGVGDGATYDLWWHGGARSAPTRHNMIGLLTEAASVKIATPITQDTSSLHGHARGLPRYERRVNFPNPWPGGTWRLRDIVDYELIAAEALVRLASDQREEFVRNFVSLGRTQLRLGATAAPYAYVIPAQQWDPSAAAQLARTLIAGGVEVAQARDAFTAGTQRIERGSYVISMAQPYRAHAKDLLEVQRFPKLEQYPGGPPEKPYDVAGWTLPMQMGVNVAALDAPLPATAPLVAVAPGSLTSGTVGDCGGSAAIRARNTSCYATRARSGGRVPRIAIYRSWTGNIDEGWTRWLLEQYKLPYVTLTDSMARAGALRDRFDVVLVPDMTLREVRDGMKPTDVPPQFAGGLGEAGLAALKTFTDAGGTLVLLDHASEIATSAMGIAIKRIVVPARLDDDGDQERGGTDSTNRRREPLYAPGSILRVLVDGTQAVGYGMPDTAAVYFTNSTTFDVPAGSAAKVIARYPARGEDILLSGYLQGATAIAGKAAAVEVPSGRGRVIMFGFRPQYRGQSYGTFRMLFNALLEGEPTAPRS